MLPLTEAPRIQGVVVRHYKSLNSALSYSFTSRHRRLTRKRRSERGKARPQVRLWALGAPLPLILVIWLVRDFVS